MADTVGDVGVTGVQYIATLTPMSTRSSELAAARRRALEKVQAQESKRLESIAENAAALGAESSILASLRRQMEEHEGLFRGHVDALVKLGKTVDEIADLAEVDVSAVRAARRPVRGPKEPADGASSGEATA